MFKKICKICLFLFSIACFSQNTTFKAPDYKAIEKNIKDKKSVYYYPELFKKLKANDTLLTQSQYEHLYYGYIFQTAYNPYGTFSKDKELFAYYQSEPKTEDIPKIKELLLESLTEFPFDFPSMNFLAYLYHLEGETEKAQRMSHIFQSLINTIIESGDGLTCETAIHVLYISHEYRLMQLFELENKAQYFDGTCDFLQLDPEYYTIPGLYFNVSQLQAKNLELLQAKPH